MTRSIGLDLGSRRTKAVFLQDGTMVRQRMFEAWPLAQREIKAWVDEIRSGDFRLPVGTTGYSRKAAGEIFMAAVLPEIQAFALGTRHFVRGTRTLVDLGGQDAKAMALDEDGQVTAFEMNDKCAAGTGKFFELLANTLGMPLEMLSTKALAAPKAIPVAATCAVFAESEIVGLLAGGADPGALARGVFVAVAERLGTMLQRTGIRSPALLVGGGANPSLAAELNWLTRIPFSLHDHGALFGAVGAALHAASGKEHP